MGAKVRAREGNNPDKHPGCLGDWTTFDQLSVYFGTLAVSLGCLLGSSNSFKECVTAHWSSDRA